MRRIVEVLEGRLREMRLGYVEEREKKKWKNMEQILAKRFFFLLAHITTEQNRMKIEDVQLKRQVFGVKKRQTEKQNW